MEEDILELIAQNNSEMQELYLSEEFEELLEICNKSTSDVALLYKALALFEMCNFQEGAEAYIQYIEKSQEFSKTTENCVHILAGQLESSTGRVLFVVDDLHNLELKPFSSPEAKDIIDLCTNLLKYGMSVIDAAQEQCDAAALLSAKTALCNSAISICKDLLDATNHFFSQVCDVHTEKAKATAKFDTNANMRYTMLEQRHIEVMHLLHPACIDALNLCLENMDACTKKDDLSSLAKRLVDIILETLNAQATVEVTLMGVSAPATYMLLGYKKDTKTNFEQRQAAINFLEEAIEIAEKFVPDFIAPKIPSMYDPNEKPKVPTPPPAPRPVLQEEPRGGCYVATAVYGSYDCPEVWTLRRYRDNTLAQTLWGRAFIHTYYAVSPTLVKWFGNTTWFRKFFKNRLDKFVARLQQKGTEDTPYSDKQW